MSYLKILTKILRRPWNLPLNLSEGSSILTFLCFRSNAPWAEASLLVGLDKDLKFKVWAPEDYKEAIYKEIEDTLHTSRRKKAGEYIKNIAVIGLKQPFQFERDAAVTLLPGQRLHLSNGKRVRLTAFFVAGTKVYALSTTHTDDLTGDWVKHVYYDTGTNQYNTALNRIALGEIVSHVCEGSPFREACLIKVYPEQLKCVSELLMEMPPRFISNIYDGEIKHLPFIREQCRMSCGPGNFSNIECIAVLDIKHKEEFFKDAVVWKPIGSAGGAGESGSGIFGLSEDGEVELVAMYIGRGLRIYKGLLISHGMKATIDFFSEMIGQQLEIYNPETKMLDARNTSQTSELLDTSAITYAAEATSVSNPPHVDHSTLTRHPSGAESAVSACNGYSAPAASNAEPAIHHVQQQAGSEGHSNGMSSTSASHMAFNPPQANNGVDTVDGEDGVGETYNQLPNTNMMIKSTSLVVHRDSNGTQNAQKRKGLIGITEEGGTKRKKQAVIRHEDEETTEKQAMIRYKDEEKTEKQAVIRYE